MSDVLEVDAITGQRLERPFTPEEVAQREADALAEAERVTAEADRVAGVQSAQAELQGLGLGDAAIATISGYPYPYAG